MDSSIEDMAPVGIMESSIINQAPTPQMNNNYQSKNNNDLNSLEKKLEEQGNEINELKKENKLLKNQLNEAFQNIISIYNKLNKFNKLDNCLNKINQFDLNFLYNSLDNQLYKLEESYKSLNHDIIKNRGELGLINSGVKRQLNASISKCILKYKSSVDGKNPDVFHLKCDNIFYKLFIIKTTNEKRFGVFFSNGKQNRAKLDNINLYNSYRNTATNYDNFFSTMNSINSLENFFSDTMSMDFANNNDKKNEIFNCKSHPDKFFVFSLNRGRVYYPTVNSFNSPCFSINYDTNRESFYGKEKKVNINSQMKDYILSGREEFNILEFEVYEIEAEN